MAARAYGPNYIAIVVEQIRTRPEINLAGEDHERGRLVDAVACYLNGGTPDGPWGRKARQRGDAGSRNGDALTYRRSDGLFEIVDILKGLEENPPADRTAYADYTHKGTFADGQNGYWFPADAVEPPAPQSIAEARDYFFRVINREIGSPARDWEAVLSASGFPNGPGPMQRSDPKVRYGITQQIGAGGVRGRLFLPTGEPDALGYYTRPFDVLDGTAPDLRWAWKDLGGPPYVPVTGGGGTVPGGNQGGGGGSTAGLEQQLAEALRRIGQLEDGKTNLEGRLDAVERGKGEQDERVGRLEGKVDRLVVEPGETAETGFSYLRHKHGTKAQRVVDRDTLPKPKKEG